MTTTGTDIEHPRFARMYMKAADRMERRGAGEHRHKLLEGLCGRVLELGAGNGLNFAHYPATVTGADAAAFSAASRSVGSGSIAITSVTVAG